MEEYISRKSLLQVVDSYEPIVQGPHDGIGLREHAIWAGMCEAIQDMPAANVAPVVEAEWMARARKNGIGKVCSECREVCLSAPTNFCPNCGARMRREGGE